MMRRLEGKKHIKIYFFFFFKETIVRWALCEAVHRHYLNSHKNPAGSRFLLLSWLGRAEIKVWRVCPFLVKIHLIKK